MSQKESIRVELSSSSLIAHSLRVIMPLNTHELFAKTFDISFSTEGVLITSLDGIAIRFHKENAILIIHPPVGV